MNLRLRVLNGPLKGQFTPIKAGIIIGRGPNRLGLRDPKISTNHAKIIQNKAGQLIMQDLGSRNGIKVGGRLVKEVVLLPDTQLQLGQTRIRVETIDQVDATPPKVELEVEAEAEVPPPEWPEFFQDFIDRTKKKIKDKPKQLVPFPSMLHLKFLRGPQIESKWSMGYGPREIGRSSLDFPLYDENAPELAFRIRSEGLKMILETPHSNLVLINKKYVSTEELKDGDLISIGSSLIQVSIKEL